MTKKDHRELVDFIGQQFGLVFGLLAKKPDGEEVMQIVKEETGKILGILDEHAKAYSDQKQEHDMLAGQVGRHDKWINKIALKTNVKLDH